MVTKAKRTPILFTDIGVVMADLEIYVPRINNKQDIYLFTLEIFFMIIYYLNENKVYENYFVNAAFCLQLRYLSNKMKKIKKYLT